MDRKHLKVGGEYGLNSRMGFLLKATLLSLEPLQVTYEDDLVVMGKPPALVIRSVAARDLVCLWKDKDEWDRERAEKWEERWERRLEHEKEADQLTEQLLEAGYKKRLPAGFRAPSGGTQGFVLGEKMLKRLLAGHPEFAHAGRLEDTRELTEQLLEAGYKKCLPAGFRTPNRRTPGFTVGMEMLKRLLAGHPEFEPVDGSESALAELLVGDELRETGSESSPLTSQPPG